jgi:hypothetical protein
VKINDLDQSIDSWIKELEQYDFIQLCAKPSPTSWSLGQVCMHLIENTNYYVDQIKMCVNAREWFQFADMHFRHHLRQKKRIEKFLEINR